MFCPHCGERNPDDAEICSACERSLSWMPRESAKEKAHNRSENRPLAQLTPEDIDYIHRRIEDRRILGRIAPLIGLFFLVFVICCFSYLTSVQQHSGLKPVAQVTFDVSQVQTAIAQDATPTPDILLNDLLTSVNKGVGGWQEDTSCQFKQDGYHISTGAHSSALCWAEKTDFSDFQFQVTVNLASGSAGMLFCGDPAQGTYYSFVLDNAGNYKLALYPGSGKSPKTLASGFWQNAAMSRKTLAVAVSQGSITLMVDDDTVDTVNNAALSGGKIGVIASGKSAEATFSEASVWALSS